MIKEKHSYSFFNLLYLLKHWIIFCFLLFIVVKPVVIAISLIVDSKYEIYDNLAKENTEEKKENISDDERINHSIDYKTSNYTDQSLSCYYNSDLFLSFKPKIHLRPPIL